MAKQDVVIEVDIQGTAKVESMRTQMRKLREELATLPEGTAEFTRVQKQLGELKDKMDDLGKSVNTMSGEPLERLNNSFGMIGSSIMSLDFGAAQTGIQGVSSAIKDFKFGDLIKGAKSFGGTMLDLGKSLMMNPIFAIAGLLILIITNFEKLTSAGGLVGKVFGFIGDQIAIVKDAIVDFLNWTGIIDSEASDRAEEQKKRNEEMIADLQKANNEVEKMRNDVARSKMSEREKELADIKKWYDDQLWLARGDANLQAEVTKLAREKQAQINDKYDKQDADKATAKREKNKAENAKDAEERKRVQDEMDALQEKWYQEDLEREKKQRELLRQIKQEQIVEEETLAQEIQNIKQGAQATELQNVQDEYFEKIAAAQKLGLDSLALEEELKKKQGEINDKYRKTEEDKEKALQEAKYRLAQAALTSLTDLNDAFTEMGLLNAEQSFKVNKALQLAQATMSGYLAVNAVLADVTIPSVVRIPLAVATGISAAANVAKIAAMKFNKGGSGGGGNMSPSAGGGGGMGGSSTNAPMLDLSFINGQTNKPQPLQAYVLATNVSSAQEAQQKIKDQSKIIK